MHFSLNDLLIAFKKAKSEVYHEKLQVALLAFPQYEKDLNYNLNELLNRLNSENVEFVTAGLFNSYNGFYPIAKKINFDEKHKDEPNVYYSSLKSRWKDKQSKIDNIDFRIISNLNVEFHIISSLWIDHFAYELEKGLSNNSYGSRLNVAFNKPDPSVSHFRSYIADYRKWQKKGLDTIREKLNDVDELVAATADIKSFYHHIDVHFLLGDKFLNSFSGRLRLNPKQIYINRLLVKAIAYWSQHTYSELSDKSRSSFFTQTHVGIPIGLSASKVIANLVLKEFDAAVEQQLMPLYYGRYVDDIFLVIGKNDKITSRQTLWDYLSESIGSLSRDSEGSYKYKLSNGGKTRILFNKHKERIFFLDSKCGLSIVNEIENELNDNSSEWRLLPDAENNLDRFTDEIIHANSDVSETVNSLRKSDGISIKRLKYALFVRSAEDLVLTHPEYYWKKGVQDLFRITANFILDPDILNNYLQFMVRVFRIAVYNLDFRAFENLYESLMDSINLMDADPFHDQEPEIGRYRNYLIKNVELALLTGGNFQASSKKRDSFNSKIDKLIGRSYNLDQVECFFITDLHLIPLKNIFENRNYELTEYFKGLLSKPNLRQFLLAYKEEGDMVRQSLIKDKVNDAHNIFREFVNGIYLDENIPIAFFLPTRKMSYLEITRFLDRWLFDQRGIFLSFLTLYELKDINLPINENGDVNHIIVNHFPCVQEPVIAITSYKVLDESWEAHIQGRLEPDTTRLSRLYNLINDILIKRDRKIDFIVLPELSLPHYAINRISRQIMGSGITLIAGAEYNIDRSTSSVQNQMVFIIPITVGSRTHQVRIIQEKLLPASHEATDLFQKAGLKLVPVNINKYIFTKNGFTFSGLICNDFLNIDNRQKLRGKIDALFLVEWNRDIETYNSLVESAANDLHSYIIQVNNRRYGDTRIRAPFKEAYQRDVARIRGGLLDYFVISALDINALRVFQMNKVSPSKPFKPVPTGFVMDPKRKLK